MTDQQPISPSNLGEQVDLSIGDISLEDCRISLLPGYGDHAASFEILDEDHTLGNALRYVLNKNPEVDLCGYSIPHPSEPKMNLRIQTTDRTTVYEALDKAFDDLMDLCSVVTEKFKAARDEYNTDHMS